MSRSAVPSQEQLEMLVECMEEQRWLATGHARTANARDRTKVAWGDIAVKLNSDGRGCLKTWQQWSKESSEDHPNRKELEEAISLNIPSASTSDVDSSISILQSITVEPGTIPILATGTEESTPSIPDPQPGPSWRRDNLESIPQYPAEQQMYDNRPTPPPPSSPPPPPQPPPPPTTSRRSATLSPRRRLTAPRRRLLRRSPPSQRQSQLRSLTERFVAIEERRVETERILAENQRALVHALQQISDAWLRQSQSLSDLVQKIKK
ncbi:proline-rich protein 12-like isoform X2 [Galleria mellonella]|uniref:Regulatory protein zeste n=1 Tax=Galleria mellonella TaxID=7137 RepID=A0ABM3M8Y8_GALME|nr:proline-rich protein 12-like isoform X2 [Galleria mellonella]XP_052748898.1 proline-rich protein 12-like isoform X2 [Galleria mellonella]XP_052755697.1 proline-rich protein 12-like isoform X2 [Galleria mellonella]